MHDAAFTFPLSPSSFHRRQRLPLSRSRIALALVSIALSGCASAGKAWRAGPAGIEAEQLIRGQLVSGQASSLLVSLQDKKVAPADKLLQHMYRGVAALHAGEWEVGTRALDRAWQIADDRWTKRIGDAAAGLATGEGALPYSPPPAERMFIPYYGALNWIARNERDPAAVEARRLSGLLASENDAMPDPNFLGGMRYIAGVVFESSGERNDADVAYRNAAALLGGALPADTLPPPADSGDVVVLIEDGFVVRPEPATLDFWVSDDEVALLDGTDDALRYETFHRVRGRRHHRDWDTRLYRNVSLRWPQMPDARRADYRASIGARVWSGEAFRYAPTIEIDVSAQVRADFERRQPARLSRALARAAVREFSLNGAGKVLEATGKVATKKDDDDDDDDDKKSGKGWKIAAGLILSIGLLAIHTSSTILDQPDLRAWQVLPDRVAIARFRLPAGEHQVEVTRDGEAFTLGAVTVEGGRVTVMTHRWWPQAPRVIVTTSPDPVGASEAGVRATRLPDR
jgi:hypothetical protein